MIRRLLDRIGRRRRRQYAGCIDCGSTITQYVVLDHDFYFPARCCLCPACATCPGADLSGLQVIRMKYATDWTIGEIEDRVDRYESELARIEGRRERINARPARVARSTKVLVSE